MCDSATQELLAARRRLQQWEQAQQEYRGKSEAILQCNARLGLVATQIELIQKDLKDLEGLSVAGVLNSLLGAREEKLRRKTAQLEEANTEIAQLQQELSTLQLELDAIKQLIAAGDEIKSQYDTACEQQVARLCSGDDEAAQTIRAVLTDLTTHEQDIHQFERAIEEGKHACTGMQGLRKMFNGVSKRRMGCCEIGLVRAAYNKVMTHSTKPAVSNFRSSMQRFYRVLSSLNIPDKSELDTLLVSGIASVEAICSELDTRWAAAAMDDFSAFVGVEDQVQELIYRMTDKLEILKTKYQQLEQQKSELLFGAQEA